MPGKGKKALWTLVFAGSLLAVVIVLVVGPYRICLGLAAYEYFQPTTTEFMPFPFGCNETREAVPQGLHEVIEIQRRAYRLTLQEIKLCRTSTPLPEHEPDFTEKVFTENTRKKWLPSYVGCCTYQFRRHFTVVLASADQRGSIVVMAALLESRLNYLRFLRLHCDEKLRAWL